jgi:peptidyl-prolyl cis-trans isomerase C
MRTHGATMPTVKFTSLLMLAALAGCDQGTTSTPSSSGVTQPPAADAGETLATVNGLTVGSTEYEAAAARKVPEAGEQLSSDEKKEVLDRLVDEKLLYLAALDKGLDQDPKVQKVMINTLLREAVYSNVRNSDFTDEVLQKYFDDNKDDFVVPAKVQIKRILIKVTDDRPLAKAKSMAKDLRKQINKDPSKFKDLASKHSEDPYRRRGGDVGFVPKSGKPGLDQKVVDMAFTLKPGNPGKEVSGEVSKVFKTEDGFNIVMAANKRDKVERTFQQMKGSVLRKVKNEKLKSLYESFVGNLRDGAKIDLETSKLDGIEIKAARRPAGPGFGSAGPGSKHGGRLPSKLKKGKKGKRGKKSKGKNLKQPKK